MILLCLAGIIYGTFYGKDLLNYYHKYRVEQIRKHKYDEARKIEKVLKVKFPEFKTIFYEESFIPSKLLPKHICKATAEFTQVPSQEFYHVLDSLCAIDTVKWRKYNDFYVFDSIYGLGTLSKIELSLSMEKGEKEFRIEYDDTPNFNVKLVKDRNKK